MKKYIIEKQISMKTELRRMLVPQVPHPWSYCLYCTDGCIWGGKDDRVGIYLSEVWEYKVDLVVYLPGDIDMPNLNLT